MARIGKFSLLGFVTLLVACGDGVYRDLNQHRTRIVYTGEGEQRGLDAEPDGNQGSAKNDNESLDDLADDPGGEDLNEGEAIEDPNSDAFNLSGEVRSITALGEVYGWAVNEDDLDARLEVFFYVDGPPGQGSMAGSTMANREGFTGGFAGNYAYQFALPVEFRNAAERDLYVYTSVDGEEAPVVANVIRYTAYTPTQEGRNYYQSTLRPLLVNNCGGCHPAANELTYENHYQLLLSPAPSANGSATNNLLINKAARVVAHGGNNRCGGNGVNGNPCAQMQQWWSLEFGN